jgi:hypothetical protein
MAGGFRVVGTGAGSEPSFKAKYYDIAAAHATRVAIGDCVVKTGTANAATGNALVDAAAAGAALTGVIVGRVPDFANESFSDTGVAASTAATLIVCDDPEMICEVDVANGPLVVANVGLNGDIVATAATQSGGLSISNMTFNATGINTTNTLQWTILELLVGSDGVLGSRVKVKANNTTARTGVTGV